MRCDCCPFSSNDEVCPEAEGDYGIEHKDGVLGCKHPRNWIDKREKERAEHYCDKGTDMGIEISLSETELKKALDICKHMIGLNCCNPYHRHGRAFYKPYRNYYYSPKTGNALLDKLPNFIISKKVSEFAVTYILTPAGLGWLSRQLNITIKQEEC